MPVNSDKPHLWKADIAASVDQFNQWFMAAAPQAYRETRARVTGDVVAALVVTDNHRALRPDVLYEHPKVLPTLRMSTSPPLAMDRLIGLAGVGKTLIFVMEKFGRIPPRMPRPLAELELAKVCLILGSSGFRVAGSIGANRVVAC